MLFPFKKVCKVKYFTVYIVGESVEKLGEKFFAECFSHQSRTTFDRKKGLYRNYK